MRIKHIKMTIGEKPKQKSQTTIFKTPYCSHKHRSQLEARECQMHARMKLIKMRGR